MYLIAGLGNPTLKYRNTRHNVGFMALDFLAKEYKIPIKKKKYMGLYGEGRIEGERVALLKPQTYMNKSGESIHMALKSLGLSAEDLIVFVDDIALDCGRIRIRKSGSSGGHNGLKNIAALVGTDNFARIRIGAGKLPQDADMIKHVLSKPKREDFKNIKEACEDAGNALKIILSRDIETAMNEYNGKQRPSI